MVTNAVWFAKTVSKLEFINLSSDLVGNWVFEPLVHLIRTVYFASVLTFLFVFGIIFVFFFDSVLRVEKIYDFSTGFFIQCVYHSSGY